MQTVQFGPETLTECARRGQCRGFSKCPCDFQIADVHTFDSDFRGIGRDERPGIVPVRPCELLCSAPFRAKIDVMKMRSTKRLGVYVSYNEKKNGVFDEAVEISKQPDGLIWLDKAHRKPERLNFPTEIIVRMKGEARYFRGILDAMKLKADLHPNFALNHRSQRPAAWHGNTEFKSALFVRDLRAVPLPFEVKGRSLPQGPVYFEL